jgi:hypothetical protein
MPWSDWQTGDVVPATVHGRPQHPFTPVDPNGYYTAPQRQSNSNVVGDFDAAASARNMQSNDVTGVSVSPGRNWIANGARTVAIVDESKGQEGLDFFTGAGVLLEQGVATIVADNLAPLNEHPALLDTLRNGVDYGIQPGKHEGDPDAYVEYDLSDPPTFVGWDDWKVNVECRFTATITGPKPADDIDIDLTIQLDVGTAMDPTDEREWTETVGSGDPSVLLTESRDTSANVTYGTSPAVGETSVLEQVELELSTLTALEDIWTLRVRSGFMTVPTWHDVPTIDLTMPLGGTNGVQFLVSALVAMTEGIGSTVYPVVMPVAHYRQPRWRYWIPEGIQPFRLAQRNDGLGPNAHPRILSSPGGSPSSVQRGNAARLGTNNRYI